MPITPTVLDAAHYSAPNPVTTAAVSPTADRLYLVAISNHNSSGNVLGIPTFAGNGLTWTLVETITDSDASAIFSRTLTVFCGEGSSTSGSPTVDFPDRTGTADASFEMIYSEWSDTPLGLAGIVQADSAGVATSATPRAISLNPFKKVNNMAVGFIRDESLDTTIGPGFAELETVINPLGGIRTGQLIGEYAVNLPTVEWGGDHSGQTAPQVVMEIGVSRAPWLRQRQRDDAVRVAGSARNMPSSLQRGIRSHDSNRYH